MMNTNMDVNAEALALARFAINCIGDVVKHSVDKKTEAAKYHDDVLKQINQLDNASKTERLKLVIAATAPLIAAGALYLNSCAKKKEKMAEGMEEDVKK